LSGESRGERRLAMSINPFEGFSARKRSVLRLVAKGRANKQIAAELDPPCKEETVKTYLRTIYAELGVANRAEAAALWVRWSEDELGRVE
jgi:DNA-binding NarL/FixJ family response regulator